MIQPDEDLIPGDHLGPEERDPEAPAADAVEQATPANPADAAAEVHRGLEVVEEVVHRSDEPAAEGVPRKVAAGNVELRHAASIVQHEIVGIDRPTWFRSSRGPRRQDVRWQVSTRSDSAVRTPTRSSPRRLRDRTSVCGATIQRSRY